MQLMCNIRKSKAQIVSNAFYGIVKSLNLKMPSKKSKVRSLIFLLKTLMHKLPSKAFKIILNPKHLICIK